MGLSVVIITRNEARHIADCLASVAFADERIVLDSGSTDDTVEIARRCGARVEVDADWQGFGVQKNRVLAYATHDWVLSLDADERIPVELALAIQQMIAAAQADAAQKSQADHPVAWRLARRSYYCGRLMRHGDWRRDWIVRLFRRGQAQFSEDVVHEVLHVNGKINDQLARYAPPLLHYSFDDFSQVLRKVDHYSTLGAQQRYRQGQHGSVGRALWHGLWTFLRGYLLRGGFLDGAHGLTLAISNAEGTYYRYLKLWHLGQPESPLSSK